MARPIAKDYDAKRSVILKRAARLFADEGFDRTSVSRVARACAISKANIYHYYASKDDILFDILDAHLSGLRNRIVNMQISDQTVEEKLRRTVTEILLAYQGADSEHRLQTNMLDHLPAPQKTKLLTYQRDLVTHVSGIIAQAAPPSLSQDKAKLRAATMSVFGMLNWFYMWNKSADEEERKDYANLICTLCLKGLSGI